VFTRAKAPRSSGLVYSPNSPLETDGDKPTDADPSGYDPIAPCCSLE